MIMASNERSDDDDAEEFLDIIALFANAVEQGQSIPIPDGGWSQRSFIALTAMIVGKLRLGGMHDDEIICTWFELDTQYHLTRRMFGS